MDDVTQRIIILTSKLVTLKTFDQNFNDYKKCISFIDEYLQDVPGLKRKFYKVNGFPSALFYFNKKSYSKINLNGHIDVVKGKKEQFTAEKRGNKLFGRGTYDMKTACAVFIELFKNEPELMRKKDVSLMLVSDEELTGENGTQHILKNGFKTDFCISGEPTDLMITREVKNSTYLKVVVRGKSAHSSRPWLGVNPVNIAAKLVSKIQARYPTPKKITHGVTISITDIHTLSNSTSSIPDSVTFLVNVRFHQKADENKILQTIKKICAPNAVTVAESGLPIYTPADNSYIKQFRSVLEKHNLPTKFRKGFGTADVRFYTQQKIPNIGFGLKGIGAHGNDEQIELTTIQPYYAVLLDFIYGVKN